MSYLQVVQTDDTRKKFASYYQAVNKIEDPKVAENLYAVELHFFSTQLSSTPALQACTAKSIANVFLEVIGSGCTFDPGMKHVYLMPGSVKTAEGYEKRLRVEYSYVAEIKRRVDAGSIIDCHVDLVYEGDKISVTKESGRSTVSHQTKIPRGKTIIGAVVYINKPDGSIDQQWIDIDEMDRLAKFSARKNRFWDKEKKAWATGKPNALYSSGNEGQPDSGFFKTKCVQIAMKYYPTSQSKYVKPLEDNLDELESGNGSLYIEEPTANVIPAETQTDPVPEDAPMQDTEEPNYI